MPWHSGVSWCTARWDHLAIPGAPSRQVSALPADTVVWSSLPLLTLSTPAASTLLSSGPEHSSSAHLIVSLVHASLLDAKNNTSLMLKSWKIEIKPTTQVTRSVAV